jgi:hypothetical protein
MTTPPSDPYGTPPSGQGDDQPAQQPPPYSAPGQGPPAYPGQPYGGQPDTPVDRPEPPSSILAAVKLMYVGAGLSLLGILFTFTARGSIRDQLAEDNPGYTASELDTAVNVAVIGAVVIGGLSIALWLWMAYANKHGQGWARIVATVLGGLNIVFTLFSLTQSAGFGIILNFASIALAGAILFLLYRPDSSAYYNAVSNRPRY